MRSRATPRRHRRDPSGRTRTPCTMRSPCPRARGDSDADADADQVDPNLVTPGAVGLRRHRVRRGRRDPAGVGHDAPHPPRSRARGHPARSSMPRSRPRGPPRRPRSTTRASTRGRRADDEDDRAGERPEPDAADPPRRSAGQPSDGDSGSSAISRHAVQWHRNASTVQTWKISWKPKWPGHGFGPLHRVDDRAAGVEQPADGDEDHHRGVRLRRGRAGTSPRPSRARDRGRRTASAARRSRRRGTGCRASRRPTPATAGARPAPAAARAPRSACRCRRSAARCWRGRCA